MVLFGMIVIVLLLKAVCLVEYHQLVGENKINKNSIYFINDSKELYLGDLRV